VLTAKYERAILMILMDWAKKIADIIMPIDNEEEEVVENKEKIEQKPLQMPTQAQNLAENVAARRAAATANTNISTTHGTATVNGVNYTAYTDTSKTNRPNLQIIKAPEFVMKVYTPADYNHVNEIADDVLAHKAVVVNYEYVHASEQRRICDYIDGVCYAIDGAVTQIAEKIFLYVPAGISTSDIAALVASVRYH
jgi:cell division inhibitor SepF